MDETLVWHLRKRKFFERRVKGQIRSARSGFDGPPSATALLGPWRICSRPISPPPALARAAGQRKPVKIRCARAALGRAWWLRGGTSRSWALRNSNVRKRIGAAPAGTTRGHQPGQVGKTPQPHIGKKERKHQPVGLLRPVHRPRRPPGAPQQGSRRVVPRPALQRMRCLEYTSDAKAI